jgi:hypothetical protein
MAKNYHHFRVSPSPCGEWILTRDGCEHALGAFESKAFAVNSAQKKAARHSGAFTVHRRDRTVEEYRGMPANKQR